MKKKNIVVFTNTLLSGGAERQALLLATQLKDSHQVFLVVYYGDKIEEKFRIYLEDNKINTIYLKGSHLNKVFRFWKLLRVNKISVIFSYLLTTNLIGATIGKLAGVKTRVGGIRNAVLDKKKLPVQRFINNYLSTHTIYNNYEGLQKLGNKGFNTAHSVVIPNCFQLANDHIIREDKGIVNIITVGRFVQQKGYFEALKIIKQLTDTSPNIKYFIVGFGELESTLRKAINDLKLNDFVEIVINPDNLSVYYIQSDIYLCTSFFEGLSNTIMEALSFSLPVVATNVGDNCQLVKHDINGFLIPKNNYDALIEPLKTLISSAELRNKFGRESYRIIKDNYGSERFMQNYEDFLDQAVDK